MKNSQKTKKHHFVPECYLKNFLRDGVLYTLDVRRVQKGFNEYPRINYPGKICYKENYYKIFDELREGAFGLNDYDSLFIESDVLYRIENRFGRLFQNITELEAISLSDAIDWSDFIILMKFRNPFWVEKIMQKNKDSWIGNSMQDIYKSFLNDPRYSHIPADIQKMLNDRIITNNKNDLHFSKKMQLTTLVNRHTHKEGMNEKFRNALINCHWYLLIAEREPFFITSDNPGFSLTEEQGIVYNTKFTDGFSFYYPLSPQCCLLINDFNFDNCYSNKRELKSITRGVASADFVIQVNNKTIRLINNLLIASDTWFLSQIAIKNKPPYKTNS